MTDPHSPAEYRSDMVRNVDAWYPAFNVQTGESFILLRLTACRSGEALL